MKTALPHIAIICSRLDLPGGTERASVNLANLLVNEGHPVTVYIIDETDQLFFPLHPSVQVIHLPLHFGITGLGNVWSRKLALYTHVRKLKKSLRAARPQFIIGTEYHLTIAAYLAARQSNARIISWEHHHINWLQKNRFWNFLWKRVYPGLHAVVCLNSKEKALFEAMGCSATVIPLLVPPHALRATLQEEQVLTIGWLIERKGIDLIPRIGELVFKKHPGWKWKVIGRGALQERFLEEIRCRGLQNNFILQEPGMHDLSDEYLRTSIYVMTSRFECLPMVLLEAASYGIPGVAFDCPTGPSDIIRHGKNGYLLPVEDVEGLAAAITALIEQPSRRVQLGAAALESSRRYTPANIYILWKALFESLSAAKK